MRTAIYLLFPLIAGCAQAPVDQLTSAQVIASMAQARPQPHWRLSMDGFASETGGAAVRQSSMEHVVTRQPQTETRGAADGTGLVTRPLGEADLADTQPSCQTDSDDIERARRKYCRHQLDMTDCDREIIRTTPMPERLKASCNPKSLKK
ncbi:hypothetical protein ACQE3D_24855 (plasmid) [Methylomonas sp. MS20]|uniref:hypothetical protein n=1 Tax=Methylomonas sp. MS20 TaxID=3418769 RepID=UPI003D08B4AF